MSLSTAFNILNSSFNATAAQTALTARNIANVNTPGYSRKTQPTSANVQGVAIDTVARATNTALLEQLNASSANAATQQAILDALKQLSATVSDSATTTSTTGALANGQSPSALMANLQAALRTFKASPADASSASAVVTSAVNLAGALNAGSTTVNSLRASADANMTTEVGQLNDLLGQFGAANATIVAGLKSGADVTDAMDTRDSLLTRISGIVGTSTTTDANGSMSIYTDSGVTLFQNQPRVVSMAPTATLSSGVNGAPVIADGVPITGTAAPMAIQTGALAGNAALRDTIAPSYQKQLDQMAGALISAFSETDQSATPTKPALAGLFTINGATTLANALATPGLAGELTVNANVDPARGGNPLLLRDGGISNPTDPAYTENKTGAASFTGRIDQMLAQFDATRAFDPSSGIAPSMTLPDYASASVGWLQGQYQQATSQSDYQNAVATQASAALSNATGVNLDSEMNTMLNLENSYSATAKLLTTVNAMFASLLAVVGH